jgi:hypothetical protein
MFYDRNVHSPAVSVITYQKYIITNLTTAPETMTRDTRSV